MTKIEELKKLSPQQRVDCVECLFQKNQEFFRKNHPSVGELIHSAKVAPFHINVTDDFLTITNTETGELCHPEAGLDRFSEALGDWTNSTWIDLIEASVLSYPDRGKYSQYPERFQRGMFSCFPGLFKRMEKRIINLPTLPNGKRFSNSVVFMGTFHGLHIDHYLGHTQLRNALFVEPDISRFVLSCYFLDYQDLDKRFETLLLHVGEGFPDNTLDLFFSRAELTGAVWVRVLPGYADRKFESLVHKIRLRWRRPYDTWYPAEWHLTGLRNTMENVRSGCKIFSKEVTLSSKSRIAVVGAGPSLSNDLDWLKQNQDQLVIMAVHSAVSALQKSGITPDFQFSIDTHSFTQEQLERLHLDPSVPLVNMVNDVPDKFKCFQEVLMLVEKGAIYPVRFNKSIQSLSPTTGNMALAFACCCKPGQIYLFGLDFGFRQATQTHVAESSVYESDEEHRSILGSGHLPVAANFGGQDVVTQSYFNFARLCARFPIQNAINKVSVFNCSDGARIDGADPFRASEIEKRSYDKFQDVELIRSMFAPLEESIHWHAYPLDGATQLAEIKKAMLRELKMGKFNWLKFSKKIDNLLQGVRKRVPRGIASNLDNRVTPYLQVVNSLLIIWYRLLCFSNTEEEWQQVYDEGYEQLALLIDEMEWVGGI